MKVEAALAFGGNIGDPVAAFAAALKGLRGHSSVTLGRLSSIYRTPPWGKTDQPEFLNMAALVETSLQPADLLAFWGAPNLQVVNRGAHVEKCAAEAADRARLRSAASPISPPGAPSPPGA